MRFSDVIRLVRPRQWTKNLAVFAGVLFAGHLTAPGLLLRVVLAFVALVLASSGLYAVNDATDAELDRQHPIKKDRPVACGRITRPQAYSLGIALDLAALALAWWLGWPFFACVAAYLVLQSAYSFGLKNIAIVDILVIAFGFVLRAVSGALVIAVPVSPWLVLCTGLLAIFLAAGKRRHEVVLLNGGSAEHRPVLAEYSAGLLESFMVTLSAATIASYALYTFFVRAEDNAMMVTIPFVIYGLLRYQMLVLRKDAGGRPEEVFLNDVPILIDLGLWVASVVGVLYILPLFT